MYYEEFKLAAPDTTYYDYRVDEELPLDFSEMCEAAAAEGMNSLTLESIRGHVEGMAILGITSGPHCREHTEVVSYGAVTGFEKHQAGTLAVVGAMFTLPRARRQGRGLVTIARLCEIASSEAAIIYYGHQGFLARCNNKSNALVEQLGFTQVAEELGKAMMVKLF